MNAPTGVQHVISRGPYRAVITQVAAALREFTHDGEHLSEPYPESSTPPSAAGIVLVPWANRVEDGLWHLDGKPQQLDLSEPTKHNAIHGLLRFTGYELVADEGHAVTLGATVFPQHGYPFQLATTVRYELVDDGLRVTHTVQNLSAVPAPVVIGTHPFLRIGDVPTEELTLTVHASTRFQVDDRLNPIAEIDVDGRFDLRGGTVIGQLAFDDAFGSVSTVDGASAVLRAPDGRELRLLQDEAHKYVQVYTTRIFPKAGGAGGGPGVAVALEPMTGPPNAFNSGLGVRWVEPGETWTVGWGIQYLVP